MQCSARTILCFAIFQNKNNSEYLGAENMKRLWIMNILEKETDTVETRVLCYHEQEVEPYLEGNEA
jgi:hypothetical protein